MKNQFKQAWQAFRLHGIYSCRYYFGADLALLCNEVNIARNTPDRSKTPIRWRLESFKARRASNVVFHS